MMLYPAMNELLEQVPSRYELVNVVAARARKIASKAEEIREPLDDKPVSIAIQEIAMGKPMEEEGREDAVVWQEEEMGEHMEVFALPDLSEEYAPLSEPSHENTSSENEMPEDPA